MSYTINLDFIAKEAKVRRDDYIAFAHYVELDDTTDVELDRLVEAVAAPIANAIDCKTCANCCRRLEVFVTETDAARLQSAVVIPIEEVIEHDVARAHGEWGMFLDKPCRFLNGNLCSIYAHRPESCRRYPQFAPDFRWTVRRILGGVGLCPIIYHVIERLQREMRW
jgi:hypothetical protein